MRHAVAGGEREGELMPRSEAIRELIAAAKEAQHFYLRPKATVRLRAALAAVEAEEKPHKFKSCYFTPARSLMGPCAVAFCGQPANAPIHQTGGNNGK